MFYVYCYFNPLKPSTLHECGFEPFYVGKGKDGRKKHHLFESVLRRDPNKLKTNIIKSIISQNTQPIIHIIGYFELEQDAFNEERRLIRLFGRRDSGTGPLANMTDGGEGTTNKIYTDEYRRKLSIAAKRPMSTSTKQKISAALKGVSQSKDWIEKRVLSRSGYTVSEETKNKISESHKKVRISAEWKTKMSNALRGKKHTPEHVDKCIRNNPKSQPVYLMGKNYSSIGAAIRDTGLTPGQVRKHSTFKKL